MFDECIGMGTPTKVITKIQEQRKEKKHRTKQTHTDNIDLPHILQSEEVVRATIVVR